MNIKRAFFAMAAALLLPGLAMAGTTSFVVDFSFADGNNWDTVTASIVCNGGLPLTADREVADGDVITFVLEFSEAGPNVADCDISVDGQAGYTTNYSSSGTGDNTDSTGCHFTNQSAGLSPQAQCDILLDPIPTIMSVHKEWELIGQATNASDIDFSATIRACANDSDIILSSSHFNNPSRYCVAQTVFGTATDWVDFTVNTDHNGNNIWIEESNNDSVIETDLGDCAGTFEFKPGGADQECTIVNTVFFEGIPTLNQYGLAIMALLMLAVGFVGFRRFV